METIKINLGDYKNSKATFFTGRPQGEEVRQKLDLDKIDKKKDVNVIFIIPGDVVSFNPSFYLGLLFPSYKTLKKEGFEKKYVFNVDSDDMEIVRLLNNDLEDGKRNAINSLESNTSIFDIFR